MNMKKPIIIAIPVIALLAGCQAGGSSASSSSSSSPASTPSGPGSTTSAASSGGGSAALPACSALPAATVGSALGVTGLKAPKQSGSGNVIECLYEGSGVTTIPVTINMISGSSTTALSKGEQALSGKGEPVKPYPGVGDSAYSVAIDEGPISENLLSAVKGSVQVTITSSGTLAHEGALATQIFSQAGA